VRGDCQLARARVERLLAQAPARAFERERRRVPVDQQLLLPLLRGRVAAHAQLCREAGGGGE